MFCLYSKGCEYALRALISGLNGTASGGFRVEDACREASVPESFTRKGFQRLVREGILETVRGPGGGYCLKNAPNRISVLEIIRVVDGPDMYNDCVMGLSRCADAAPCPIHKIWKRMKGKLIRELEQTTLQQMMRSSKKKAKFGLLGDGTKDRLRARFERP